MPVAKMLWQSPPLAALFGHLQRRFTIVNPVLFYSRWIFNMSPSRMSVQLPVCGPGSLFLRFR
jgi:hypothetical protein